MGATSAAGTAMGFFALALVAVLVTGFDRAATIAAVLGLIALSAAIALIGANQRRR
jgi:hypothetical protein